MIEKTLADRFWPTLADPFRAFGAKLAEWVSPAADASSDAGAYRIEIEVPGVDEKDIELTVEEGVLTVKGEKRTQREEKGKTWYFSERQYGAFSRSFHLPADAEEEGVKANLKDGVLTVTVPRVKAEKAATARKVEIARG